MNLCLLIGQVGTDPALALGYTNAGRPYLRFRLAVSSEDGKDKPATWVTVACWEELAEQVARTVSKGALVWVIGRLRLKTFEDQQGRKRPYTEIVASVVQLVHPGLDSNRAGPDEPYEPFAELTEEGEVSGSS